MLVQTSSNELIAPIIISTELLFVQVSCSLVITTDEPSIKGQTPIVFFFC